jgi:hypothetical protein
MAEWWYRRAIYNEEQQAYIAQHRDGSEVSYSFESLEPEDDERYPMLAICKEWEDEDNGTIGEMWAFMTLDKPEPFQKIVDDLLANARETAVEENVDEFLAVIDIIKHHAIEDDFDDESLEDIEGLFLIGPADAYTQREYDPERLHHHVERPDDECWQIDVARVVSAGEPTRELGWACYVIHYPELTSAATEAEVEQAQSAQLLDLEHHIDEVGARVAALHLQKFMEEGDRVQNPEYAYTNDTLMFEFMSVLSRDENEHCPTWQQLSGEALQAFRQNPVLSRSAWFPRDVFRELAEATDISPAHADQMAAMWRDMFGVDPEPFKKDSPFDDLLL